MRRLLFQGRQKGDHRGGGNTAATYVLYLHNLGASVTLIHRGSELRAESRLRESLAAEKIKIVYNAEIREIHGDNMVSAVTLELKNEGVTQKVPVDGVFLAIGYEPNNAVARTMGLKMDDYGYIIVDDRSGRLYRAFMLRGMWQAHKADRGSGFAGVCRSNLCIRRHSQSLLAQDLTAGRREDACLGESPTESRNMKIANEICRLDYFNGTIATAYKGVITSLVAKDFCITASDGAVEMKGTIIALPEGNYEARVMSEGAELARDAIEDGNFVLAVRDEVLRKAKNMQIDVVQNGRHIGTFLLKKERGAGSYVPAMELSEDLKELRAHELATGLQTRPGC